MDETTPGSLGDVLCPFYAPLQAGRAMTWETEEQITRSQPHHIPEGCLPEWTFVPLQLQVRLMTSVHISVGTGNRGTQPVYSQLQAKYRWPNDINKFVTSCSTCFTSKILRMLPEAHATTYEELAMFSHLRRLYHGSARVSGQYKQLDWSGWILKSLLAHSSTQTAHWDSNSSSII